MMETATALLYEDFPRERKIVGAEKSGEMRGLFRPSLAATSRVYSTIAGLTGPWQVSFASGSHNLMDDNVIRARFDEMWAMRWGVGFPPGASFCPSDNLCSSLAHNIRLDLHQNIEGPRRPRAMPTCHKNHEFLLTGNRLPGAMMLPRADLFASRFTT